MRYIFDDEKEKLKSEILSKAKYQKMLLLYDDFVTSRQIEEFKSLAKNDCVFNMKNIKDFAEKEINNGYKLIVYMCEIDSFIKLKFDRSEFRNIYFSNGEILPFFVNCGMFFNVDDLIVLKRNTIDNFAIKSIVTNEIYNNIKDLYFAQKSDICFDDSKTGITQLNIFSKLNEIKYDLKFVDLEILQENDLPYKYLTVLDIMIVNAFLCLIQLSKDGPVCLVDVYKVAKDDENLIDRFYSMSEDKAFLNFLKMNSSTFIENLKLAKKQITENLNNSFSKLEIEKVFQCLKESSKNNDEILSYLYFFNIFNE